MKVAIDSFPLMSEHKNRGIGFYTKYLTYYLEQIENLTVISTTDVYKHPEADLVHFPYFDLFRMSLPIIKPKPTVVTIHDLTPLVLKDHFQPGIIGNLSFFYQKLSVQGISAVITDSNHSKEDIVKYLNINSERVHPIYLAPPSVFRVISDKKELGEIRHKFNLPQKFALYIGNVNYNKNLINLTQACINANCDLVLVGKGFEDRENLDHPELESFKTFLKKFENHNLVHILGFIEDEVLVKIINLASVLLLPSLYEGFGLPILEAQSCEIPVITSNNSSMQEIAGEGAVLVDPMDILQIKNSIKKILDKEDFRKNLILRGKENVSKYSWSKTAYKTAEVYRKVLQDHR